VTERLEKAGERRVVGLESLKGTISFNYWLNIRKAKWIQSSLTA
jgi:hypothetical protein